MRHRRTLGLEQKGKALSPEKKAKQKEMASCFMVLKFHDANTWGKWSNEYAQASKIRNISDAINEMFRIFEKYFRGNVASGAIFDTRKDKKLGAHNKIYQFEKDSWTIVQAFEW